MPSTRHILIVNGRKVRQPVFIIGAPHSGTHLLAQALKRSDGVHLTIGQAAVLRVIYAFARRVDDIGDGDFDREASRCERRPPRIGIGNDVTRRPRRAITR